MHLHEFPLKNTKKNEMTYTYENEYINDMRTGIELSRQHDDDDDGLHALTFEQMIRSFFLCIDAC